MTQVILIRDEYFKYSLLVILLYFCNLLLLEMNYC